MFYYKEFNFLSSIVVLIVLFRPISYINTKNSFIAGKEMAFHHETIRRYTAALLDYFNALEVQYQDSNGTTLIKNIPLVYSTREKYKLLDGHTGEQLASGNYNVLPRANMALSAMNKLEARFMNKNNKIAKKSNVDSFDYMLNSVPYEFNYDFSIICRGMNEAIQMVEQIAPKFNPIVTLSVWDAQNLASPTKIPLKLLDINIESEEYEEFSSNLVNVTFGVSLTGNLYPPIQNIQKIKQFKVLLNEQNGIQYTHKSILGWDVTPTGTLINPTDVVIQDTITYAPTIIDIVPQGPMVLGANTVNIIWNDKDNILSEMTFDWLILQGTATVTPNLDIATVDIPINGSIEIQVTVTDPYGNFATLSKLFTI